MRPAKQIILNDYEYQQLYSVLCGKNPDKLTKKSRILLYLAEGGSLKEASEVFKVAYRTICRYKDQFVREGVDSYLSIKPIPGRKKKVPDNIGEIINDALKRSPKTIASIDTMAHNWTIELMWRYLTLEHEIDICFSHTWNMMRKYGNRCIYSKAVMTSPDPQYTEKRSTIEALKKSGVRSAGRR